MAYLDQWHLLNNADFRGRVVVAAMHVAQDVRNEADTTAGHVQRVSLAQQIQTQNDPAVSAFVLQCAMNATISAAEQATSGSSADSDLLYVVTSTWNTVAGVTGS